METSRAEEGRPGLLGEALEAAGGERRWRAIERISARVGSGGLLPRTRMPGNRLADYRLTVELDRPFAILDPFPREGERAIFERGAVRICSADGEVLRRREHPRAEFFGFGGLRRNLRWDALDSTYFAGYAMWNYLANPLLLTRPEVEVREGERWSGEGEEWRSLHARFAPELDSHSAEQTFWFDSAGRLVRHDYTAEVIGGWARAAHRCGEHREVEGIVLPTSRRVLPRRGDRRARRGPTLVWLELSEVEVAFESAAA